MNTEPTVERTIDSSVGPLRLIATSSGLRGVYFEDHRGAPPPTCEAPSRHAILDRAQAQVHEYFEVSKWVPDVPLEPIGTDFQKRVWAALRTIPYGECWSYATLAKRIERPRAIRAVASANARNPLSLFIPCHRVIGSDGRLTGYAGGLEIKRRLLDHERR